MPPRPAPNYAGIILERICTENNAGIIGVKTGIFYSRTVPGLGVKSDQARAQGLTSMRPDLRVQRSPVDSVATCTTVRV